MVAPSLYSVGGGGRDGWVCYAAICSHHLTIVLYNDFIHQFYLSHLFHYLEVKYVMFNVPSKAFCPYVMELVDSK